MNKPEIIHVACSHCGSRYSLEREKVARNDRITCSECGRTIRVVFCNSCRSPYALTYQRPEKEEYRFTCRRCSETFTVRFNRHEVYGDSPVAPKTPARPLYEQKAGQDTERRPEKTEGAGETGLFHSLLEAGRGSLTVSSLAVHLVPAVGITLISQAASLPLFAGESLPPFIRSLGTLMLPALAWFLYMGGASVRATSLMKGEGRPLRSLMVSFGMLILLLLAAGGIMNLFAILPGGGIFLFTLLLLPLYLAGLFLTFAILYSTLFLPPVLASTGGDLKESARRLFDLGRRRHLYLLMDLIIFLSFLSLAWQAFALIHGGSVALTSRLFSLASSGDVTVALPTLLGGISIFSLPLGGLTATPAPFPGGVPGILAGTFLSALSIGFTTLFLSLSASLSIEIYRLEEKERGIHPSQWRDLLILTLSLALLFALAKNVLPSL